MADTITRKEAREAEAELLAEYGLDTDTARRLIDDSRKEGGLDRLLRERARAAGDQRVHRTEDPEEDD